MYSLIFKKLNFVYKCFWYVIIKWWMDIMFERKCGKGNIIYIVFLIWEFEERFYYIDYVFGEE